MAGIDFAELPVSHSRFEWDGAIRLDYGFKELVLEVTMRTAHLDPGDQQLTMRIGDDVAYALAVWDSRRVVGSFLTWPEDGNPVELCVNDEPYFQCAEKFRSGADAIEDGKIALLDLRRLDLPLEQVDGFGKGEVPDANSVAEYAMRHSESVYAKRQTRPGYSSAASSPTSPDK